MSVSDGQKANATTFNNAFMSRTNDTDTVGKVDLKDAGSTDVIDAQLVINDNKTRSTDNETDINTVILPRLPTVDEKAAMTASTAPAAGQPFVTTGDPINVTAGATGSDNDKIVKTDSDGLIDRTFYRGLNVFANDAAADTFYGTTAAGDKYWNTTDDIERVYNGTAWQDAGGTGGTGGGVQVVGGGALDFNSGTGDFTFSSDLQLEFAGLPYGNNNISTTESPINLADGEVAYVTPNTGAVGSNIEQLTTVASNSSLETFQAVAQTFTTVGAIDVVSIEMLGVRQVGAVAGSISMQIWGTLAGVPDPGNVIATSTNSLDPTTFTTTIPGGPEKWFFNSVSLSAATVYAFVLDGPTDLTAGQVQLYGDAGNPYAGGSVYDAATTAGPWSAQASQDYGFVISSGADLTVNVDVPANVPDGDVIIGRRDGSAFILGNTSVTIGSSTANLLTRATSEFRVNTPNGHGSTNTVIRRFSNLVQSQPFVTYTPSASLGDSFTIQEDGFYSIRYIDRGAATMVIGLSLNSVNLSTGINAIPEAERLDGAISTNATDQHAVLAPIWLQTGDVIRCHNGGGSTNPGSTDVFVGLRIVQVISGTVPGGGGGGGGASQLDDLSDVDTTANPPAALDGFYFSGGLWVPHKKSRTKVFLNANQNMSPTPTDPVWGGEAFDTLNEFPALGTFWTASRDMWIDVTSHFTFVVITTAAASTYFNDILLNGNLVARAQEYMPSGLSKDLYIEVNTRFFVNSGDVVKAQSNHTSLSTQALRGEAQGYSTYFTINEI